MESINIHPSSMIMRCGVLSSQDDTQIAKPTAWREQLLSIQDFLKCSRNTNAAQNITFVLSLPPAL
jgi:hypothetical protein